MTVAVAAVARKVGVPKESLRRPMNQAYVDFGTRSGVTSEDFAELRRLNAREQASARGQRHPAPGLDFFAGELSAGNH